MYTNIYLSQADHVHNLVNTGDHSLDFENSRRKNLKGFYGIFMTIYDVKGFDQIGVILCWHHTSSWLSQ